jgi:hypothetical protein
MPITQNVKGTSIGDFSNREGVTKVIDFRIKQPLLLEILLGGF